MFKRLINALINYNPKQISFKQAIDFLGLPAITLTQGERKYNFLLDTGSDCNIINQSVLKDLDYTEKEGVQSLHGMEGKKREVRICHISLSYNNEPYPFDYLISDLTDAFDSIKKETGVTLHGIIGSKFFAKYKYVLDFAKLVAYSKA